MDSFLTDSQAETPAASWEADGKALAPTGTKLFSDPWKQSALNITFSVASSCKPGGEGVWGEVRAGC